MLLDMFDSKSFGYRYFLVQVKPKHPDFKRKVGGFSLWLSTAPDWALLKLEELEFDVLVPKGNIKLKQLKGMFSFQ